MKYLIDEILEILGEGATRQHAENLLRYLRLNVGLCYDTQSGQLMTLGEWEEKFGDD